MSRFLLVALLVLTLALRIYSNGGIKEESSDPELENIGAYFENFRNYFSERSEYLLPQPQAALLSGMVLGIKEDLPWNFSQALRKTSTIHIVVVSGQNLTMLAGMLLGFSSLIGRKKAIMLALITVFIYTLLSGIQIPVIRAFIMFFFASLASFFDREDESIWILILTGLLMLIYEPNWLLSISFQLSFLATVGVVVVAPEIVKIFKKVPDILREDFAVSLAAQALVWPIIAINFNQASLYGVLTNTLILWTVPLIMISGLIVLILSFILFPLAQILAQIPGILLTYFVAVVELSNKLGGSIYVYPQNVFIWLGYYILVFSIFLSVKKYNQVDKSGNS